MPVRLAVPPERLRTAVETAVYFICAEALANVQKYARASSVDIEVRVEGGSVVVLVADDGVGGADPSAGSGLEGLRDRIEALGGRLAIESPRGHGTRIIAAIPVAQDVSRSGRVAPEIRAGAPSGCDARASPRSTLGSQSLGNRQRTAGFLAAQLLERQRVVEHAPSVPPHRRPGGGTCPPLEPSAA